MKTPEIVQKREQSTQIHDSEVAIRSIFLCDIVRKEEGGKKILIGCYGDSVRLKTKPAAFSARVVGALRIAAHVEDDVEFRVRTPTMMGNGRMSAPTEASNVSEEGYGEFEAHFRTLVTEPSAVIFDWRVAGKEWSEPITWPLIFSDDCRTLSDEEAARLMASFAPPKKAPKRQRSKASTG